jgi:transcriptional antiterminator NusG
MLMATSDELKRHALRVAKDEWGGKIVGRSLKPLAPSLGDLVSEPDNQCTVIGDWYVVNVEPRCEDMVREGIHGAGLVPFFPMVPTEQRHGRGKMRLVERPVFPGYGFVRGMRNDVAWHKVTSTRGVHRVLANINGLPMPVTEREIETIKLYVTTRIEAIDEARKLVELAELAKRGGKSGIIWHFSEGDRVRIKEGPFAAFYAELESAVDEHDRIKALVHLFGRKTSVVLSAFQIEAL